MTPIFDSLNVKFKDVQLSSETRGRVTALRLIVADLNELKRPSREVQELIKKYEAALATAHLKKGRR